MSGLTSPSPAAAGKNGDTGARSLRSPVKPNGLILDMMASCRGDTPPDCCDTAAVNIDSAPAAGPEPGTYAAAVLFILTAAS